MSVQFFNIALLSFVCKKLFFLQFNFSLDQKRYNIFHIFQIKCLCVNKSLQSIFQNMAVFLGVLKAANDVTVRSAVVTYME